MTIIIEFFIDRGFLDDYSVITYTNDEDLIKRSIEIIKHPYTLKIRNLSTVSYQPLSFIRKYYHPIERPG